MLGKHFKHPARIQQMDRVVNPLQSWYFFSLQGLKARVSSTLLVYLAISAATSADTVGICTSPVIKGEDDEAWPAVDEAF